MSHTPGPWYDSGPHEAYLGDHSIGSVDVRVAQVMRDGLDDEEGADNARLIAAAPELLKAAQIVLAGLNARIDQASNARMPVPVFNGIADLHNAIVKATGEHNDAGTDAA